VEFGESQTNNNNLSNVDADLNLKDEDGQNSGRGCHAFSFRAAQGDQRGAEMATLPNFTGESQL
jgi:hypothetical protein